MMKELYLVKRMRSYLTINVIGMEQEVDLSWAKGMVGAVPVFDNMDNALVYAGGNADFITTLEVKRK